VRSAWIVYRKEMMEILRDRRTLMAIGLAALATPIAVSYTHLTLPTICSV